MTKQQAEQVIDLLEKILDALDTISAAVGTQEPLPAAKAEGASDIYFVQTRRV